MLIVKKNQKFKNNLLEERDAYMRDTEKVQSLVDRFTEWYEDNSSEVQIILAAFPNNLDNEVVLDMFHDLNAPWNTVESLVILTLFNPIFVSFIDENTLPRLLNSEYFEGTRETIILHLRPITTIVPGNPLSMELIVNKKLTIQQLCHKIVHILDLPTRVVKIKKDRHASEYLSELTTMESLIDNPNQIINLFYDYFIDFLDSPLISYDYYFQWRTFNRMLNK